MNTQRSLFLSIFVTLILLLVALGCEAGGGDTKPNSDIQSGSDTGNPPDDTGSPPDDSGNKPDSPDPADTPDPPPTCDDGLVELERDGETECVSASFAEAVEYIEGKELTRVEPNDGEAITLEFRHVNSNPLMVTECAGFSNFYVSGFTSVIDIACIDENLDMAMCEVDTEYCYGGNMTGEITFEKSLSSGAVILEYHSCGDLGCTTLMYEYHE